MELEVEDFSTQFGAPFLIISPGEGNRFRYFKAFDITCPRYIHWDLMKSLHVEAQLIKYLKALNMYQFATMKFDSYEQLTLEFLVSFEYDEKTKRKADFRMLGTKYEVTLQNMKVFFGFPTSGVKDKPSSFNAVQAWYELTGFYNWNPKGTSSKFLRDHALSILHKYLAYTLSGKE